MAEETVAQDRPIVTCAEARERGLKRYFSGRPCKHGHLAERLTVNGTCVECTNMRCAEWCAKNQERVRRNKQRHIDRDPSGYRAKRLARQKRMSEQYEVARRNWRERNRDKVLAIKAAWKRRNRAKGAADRMKRYAAQLQATPKWADLQATQAIYDECAAITQRTGVKHHVDHIVPLLGKAVCGLHVQYNLRIITAIQNHSKSNRMPQWVIDGLETGD